MAVLAPAIKALQGAFQAVDVEVDQAFLLEVLLPDEADQGQVAVVGWVGGMWVGEWVGKWVDVGTYLSTSRR